MTNRENRITIKLGSRTIQHPFFNPGARYWIAILTGKNAANMEREFLRFSEATVDFSQVQKGSVLEVGSNHTSPVGYTHRQRLYWLVLSITDDQIVVEKHATAAKAIKAARLAAEEADKQAA